MDSATKLAQSGRSYSPPTGSIPPTFLPTPLLPSESYGGPDGSRPCFACALKAAGLSAEGFAAEPINTADGDFYESVPIVSIPGLGPDLSYSATYDAKRAQAEVASGVTNPGPLGWGWSANDSMSVTGVAGSSTVTVNEEGGAQLTFLPALTGPGVNGSTCTTALYVLQCYVSADPT